MEAQTRMIGEAKDVLLAACPEKPVQAIVLGSGLGGFAQKLASPVVIDYERLEGFPQPTIAGHKGEAVFGYIGENPTLVLSGRFHLYEGHKVQSLALIPRVMAALGVKRFVVTNAAGGVNPSFKPGDLMLITDHLNFTGQNPLMGDNDEAIGTRFPDMSEVYSKSLRALAKEAAKETGIDIQEGVYAWMTGPSYETPAEIRMLQTLGADAVGMSTVPEAIAANHAGLEVLGISLITNMAAGILPQPLNHEEVIETGRTAAKRFEALVYQILQTS